MMRKPLSWSCYIGRMSVVPDNRKADTNVLIQSRNKEEKATYCVYSCLQRILSDITIEAGMETQIMYGVDYEKSLD